MLSDAVNSIDESENEVLLMRDRAPKPPAARRGQKPTGEKNKKLLALSNVHIKLHFADMA